MKIAMAQILSGLDLQENQRQVLEHSTLAAESGADMIVFPEATMRAFGNDLHEAAEPLDGPWATEVRNIAQDLGILIIVGMFTLGSGGRIRNTLLASGRGVDTHYDKIHLFDAFGHRESDSVEPGDHATVFDFEGISVGLATCYDLRFPNLFLENSRQGAQLHVVPTSWGAGPGKADQLDLLTRARALDSTSFVICVDQADPQTVRASATSSAPTGIGRSCVIDPRGRELLRMGGEPQMTFVEISLDEVDEARQSIPVLTNQRSVGQGTFDTEKN